MKKYIQLMRLDHWIKQLFIIPSIILAFLLLKERYSIYLLKNIILGLFSTCFIASSNYVINEWLDASCDKHHPVKKNRSVVLNHLNPIYVYIIYFGLAIIGLLTSSFVSKIVLTLEMWLFLMGILYNVKPFRLKDLPYIDALVESLNNAIRFFIGWFIIASTYFPPISIVIGYWMTGAFLMETKRYSELKMFKNKEIAQKYRKSFKYYSKLSLIIMSFFYAMSSIFFTSIFLVKYKIELIIFIPFYIILFCIYFSLAFKNDSVTQKPENLFKEKGLMLYICFLFILFIILLNVNIPFFEPFIGNELIKIN